MDGSANWSRLCPCGACICVCVRARACAFSVPIRRRFFFSHCRRGPPYRLVVLLWRARARVVSSVFRSFNRARVSASAVCIRIGITQYIHRRIQRARRVSGKHVHYIVLHIEQQVSGAQECTTCPRRAGVVRCVRCSTWPARLQKVCVSTI